MLNNIVSDKNDVLVYQDMAWGVKTMKFKSGSKIKVGNVVLEALQSQIIRDYISATEDHNLTATSQGRINICSSITYRRWLKVAILKAPGKLISNIICRR